MNRERSQNYSWQLVRRSVKGRMGVGGGESSLSTYQGGHTARPSYPVKPIIP